MVSCFQFYFRVNDVLEESVQRIALKRSPFRHQFIHVYVKSLLETHCSQATTCPLCSCKCDSGKFPEPNSRESPPASLQASASQDKREDTDSVSRAIPKSLTFSCSLEMEDG